MTSLEGIRAPTRADSDAPAGLTCLHREAPSLARLRARKGPDAWLLFDLLSSCSGLLKHAAATTSAAVTIPAVDVQRAAELYEVWTLRSQWAQVAVAETAPTAEAHDTAAVQNRGRRCSRC
jgi:hypothetical protein